MLHNNLLYKVYYSSREWKILFHILYKVIREFASLKEIMNIERV